jgi:hypothetical protein
MKLGRQGRRRVRRQGSLDGGCWRGARRRARLRRAVGERIALGNRGGQSFRSRCRRTRLAKNSDASDAAAGLRPLDTPHVHPNGIFVVIRGVSCHERTGVSDTIREMESVMRVRVSMDDGMRPMGVCLVCVQRGRDTAPHHRSDHQTGEERAPTRLHRPDYGCDRKHRQD